MCQYHKDQAQNTLQRTESAFDQPPGDGPSRAAIATNTKRQANRAINKFVIDEQARAALSKLGKPLSANFDPKVVLLDTVNTAWRTRQVWEALLAGVPEDDWRYIGTPPIPGMPEFSKGARIEFIQKALDQSTKAAARISKLAIDAGIEERLVRLAEEQSALIADTVRAAVIAAVQALLTTKAIHQDIYEATLNEALQAAATSLRQIESGQMDPRTGELTSIGEAVILDGEYKEIA